MQQRRRKLTQNCIWMRKRGRFLSKITIWNNKLGHSSSWCCSETTKSKTYSKPLPTSKRGSSQIINSNPIKWELKMYIETTINTMSSKASSLRQESKSSSWSRRFQAPKPSKLGKPKHFENMRKMSIQTNSKSSSFRTKYEFWKRKTEKYSRNIRWLSGILSYNKNAWCP